MASRIANMKRSLMQFWFRRFIFVPLQTYLYNMDTRDKSNHMHLKHHVIVIAATVAVAYWIWNTHTILLQDHNPFLRWQCVRERKKKWMRHASAFGSGHCYVYDMCARVYFGNTIFCCNSIFTTKIKLTKSDAMAAHKNIILS